MKKTNSAFVFGALVVASFAAVRCGGDDSNSAPANTAGSVVNAGGSAGSANNAGADNGGTANNGGSANNGGTANNGGANNGGANNGGANNGGANNGGSANPTDGGGGTAVGAGGTTQVGGDAGMCPAMTPMQGDMCTGNVVCLYPTQMADTNRRCSCGANGPRVDGGARSRVFACFNVPAPRDAGANPGADAGGIDRCPNGTNGGDNCNTPNAVCRIDQNSFCSCLTIANETNWFCN